MINNRAYENLLELVKKRRTIRYFRPDPIPDEYIDKIIEVARWAPSGFHTQPWEFVVVKKKEVKDKIVEVLENTLPRRPVNNTGETSRPSSRAGFKDAPVFILALCDWRTKVGLPDAVTKNEKATEGIFCSSMAGAFLYMHLAAAALGLASQWYSASGTERNERTIRNIIGIPDSLKIYDMMVVGYAALDPIPKALRKREDMVHYDNCGAHDFRTDDDVIEEAKIYKAWCLKAH